MKKKILILMINIFLSIYLSISNKSELKRKLKVSKVFYLLNSVSNFKKSKEKMFLWQLEEFIYQEIAIDSLFWFYQISFIFANIAIFGTFDFYPMFFFFFHFSFSKIVQREWPAMNGWWTENVVLWKNIFVYRWIFATFFVFVI